ncbi:hypothetical protein [Methylomicrobium sp. Wu6]|uniref:hypothetical protein n=1 Tax=Methylomicrobium sp. Wu6 TaxID=3107928 RepID=UPI002DD67A86|nr:hypothetical protein [Methylomicrobium sp. Wu6]MEC4748860.1 hypothetical protein [Methylomicrobium sp. Wu6]
MSVVATTPDFAPQQPVESDGYDVMMDIILRTVGIVGAGLFVGLSSVTVLAETPSPHDAFEKLGNTTVCKPFKWIFERPAGDYEYNGDCSRPATAPMPVAQRIGPTPASFPPPAEQPSVNKKAGCNF